MLKRQVDVAADFFALANRVDDILPDRGGVEVEQPDPLEAVDTVEPPQECGEGATLAAIDAVEGRVL